MPQVAVYRDAGSPDPVNLMQTRITAEEIDAATRQLAKHERGRTAMQWLVQAVRADALDLDLLDQRAFLALLGGAFLGQREKVRDTIQETLANPMES